MSAPPSPQEVEALAWLQKECICPFQAVVRLLEKIKQMENDNG